MSDAVSYVSEPATFGKVLLVTTIGDFDVELFSKECPKACRNFVQLCLDGYYDATIFHRVIKGFMAQCGDPTGTGMGGDSATGTPFADEFHSRLRFTRRGLVGMASHGGKDSNLSQFFLTLGPCEFLNKRHTLFAKITGDTLFNLRRFEELEIENVSDDKTGGDDEEAPQGRDRPFNPPRILRTEVLSNPFPDLVARPKAVAPVAPAAKKAKPAKKNLTLLSFGEEEGAEEMALGSTIAKDKPKSKSSHDLLDDDARLSSRTIEQALEDSRRLDQDAPSRSSAAAASTAATPASASDTAAAAARTRDALATKKRSTAAAASSSAAIDDDEFLDESAYDAKMKMQLLRQKGKLSAAAADSLSAAASSSAAAARSSAAEERKEEPLSKASAAKEYARLKSEMGISSGGSIRSAAVRPQSGPSVDDALLSPLEARRSQFKTRKQNAHLANREADTLAKLAAFKASVAAAAAAAPAPVSRAVVPASSSVEIPPVPLSDDEADAAMDGGDDRSSFLSHQIKLAKRPQDFERFMREKEGLSVQDPRGEEGARFVELPRRREAGSGEGERSSGSSSHRRDDHKRSRNTAGTAGLHGGKGGMAGLADDRSSAAAAVDIKYKSLQEQQMEEENERVVQKHLAAVVEQQQQRKRKHSRSRSRSHSRSR